MRNLSLKRGFTIFFAVLVASLALSVGLVIYDLLNRSLALSQLATQSQYAIYAADTGSECALYWDIKFGDLVPSDQDSSAFATSSQTSSNDTAAGLSNVTCNSQAISLTSTILSNLQPTGWTIASNASAATTTFWISMSTNATAPCAKIEVGKKGNPSQTTVISHGYNTCTPGVLRLERSLQINY